MEIRRSTYFVLAALLDGPLHGYGIIKRAAELSGGEVRLSTGTLQTTLKAVNRPAVTRLSARAGGFPRENSDSVVFMEYTFPNAVS